MQSNYFGMIADEVVTEFAYQREGLDIRLDHSQMLSIAAAEQASEAVSSMRKIGLSDAEMQTSLLPDNDETSIYVLEFWAEWIPQFFKHRHLGFTVPVIWNQKLGIPASELLSVDSSKFRDGLVDQWVWDALIEVQTNYEYIGQISTADTKKNIQSFIKKLPLKSLVFMILPTEKYIDHDANMHEMPFNIDLNATLRICAQECKSIRLIEVDKYLTSRSMRRAWSPTHLPLDVYFNMFKDIYAHCEQWIADA